MIRYTVDDMSCGHCVQSITRAVQALDAAAAVEIDLPAHVVTVRSSVATPDAVARAITEAGFTPQPVVAAGPAA